MRIFSALQLSSSVTACCSDIMWRKCGVCGFPRRSSGESTVPCRKSSPAIGVNAKRTKQYASVRVVFHLVPDKVLFGGLIGELWGGSEKVKVKVARLHGKSKSSPAPRKKVARLQGKSSPAPGETGESSSPATGKSSPATGKERSSPATAKDREREKIAYAGDVFASNLLKEEPKSGDL